VSFPALTTDYSQGSSKFASLIATTESGAPLPSGRGSVGAATKPAAADHAPFLTGLGFFAITMSKHDQTVPLRHMLAGIH
jgi:hypothetical protein